MVGSLAISIRALARRSSVPAKWPGRDEALGMDDKLDIGEFRRGEFGQPRGQRRLDAVGGRDDADADCVLSPWLPRIRPA